MFACDVLSAPGGRGTLRSPRIRSQVGQRPGFVRMESTNEYMRTSEAGTTEAGTTGLER